LLSGRKLHSGLPESTVNRHLEDLVLIGLVEKDEFDRGGGWKDAEYLLSLKAIQHLWAAGIDVKAAEHQREQRAMERIDLERKVAEAATKAKPALPVVSTPKAQKVG